MGRIEDIFAEHVSAIQSMENQIPNIIQAVDRITDCLRLGNALYIFGNGGSAADAQHISAELVGRFKKNRPALNAHALTTDTSILTSVANDSNYDLVFARQIEAYAKHHDVLIGISTSGNSPNVHLALERGRNIGTYNIGLTGKKGRQMEKYTDLLIQIDSENVPRIQEGHQLVYHTICELVEEKIFGDKK